jgi:DNA sulfur modification protein DndD
MIIDEVILHNYGVYAGRQTIELTPDSPNKPIILVGALNGSGKTTLLDALQLGLFGKRASCVTEGGNGYENYLTQAIHRRVSPTEGAGIEIAFRQNHGGQEQALRVHRSWSKPNGKIKENFSVVSGDKIDNVLTDQWAEYIEGMIPARIAPLFFFDGEKIEQLADPDQSARILSTAIHSLLGLDLVEQLKTDLKVYQKRQNVSGLTDADRAEITRARSELEVLKGEVTKAYQRLASANTDLVRTKHELSNASQNLETKGGNLYLERENLLRNAKEVESNLNELRDQLRDLASLDTPLAIVGNLLNEMVSQSGAESNLSNLTAIEKILCERDEWVISRLGDRGVDKSIIEEIKANFTDDRLIRTPDSAVGPYLDLSKLGSISLEGASDRISENLFECKKILSKVNKRSNELDDVDRKVASIPASEDVEPLLKRIEIAEHSVLVATESVGSAERDYGQAKIRYRTQQDTISKLYNRFVESRHDASDANRVLIHSGKVQKTVEAFRDKVVTHHVQVLEELVVQCFNQLLRKDTLISAVKIDPKTFEIQLKDSGWQTLRPEILSAGERQLFAVSLIWALGKASGRPLPTIIDTPMGRLDSVHRSHLIERYFPQASHQVILLSTDEEIGAPEYQRLRKNISRSYTLSFDDNLDGSIVKKGYF